MGLINGPSATLTLPLLCRGDAKQLDATVRSITTAAAGLDIWLEVQMVPWQLSPSGLRRATAALGANTQLTWVPHQASSEAAALNQAWHLARGCWIWWLEAGDQLMPEALSNWLRVITERPNLLLVVGEGEHLDWHGKCQRRHRALPASTWVPEPWASLLL